MKMSIVTSKYGTPDSAAIRKEDHNCYRCKWAYVFLISEGIRCDKLNKYPKNPGEAEDCKYFEAERP